MKKGLYIECNSGISGDMSVAALIESGGRPQKTNRYSPDPSIKRIPDGNKICNKIWNFSAGFQRYSG